MSWGLVAGAVIGGGASYLSGKKAADVAGREGERADAAEQQRFEEAKRQAEILRQRGDEAAAVAMEEAARAELGAQKFESLSNEYAQKAEAAAVEREGIARGLYDKIDQAALERQAAGQAAQAEIARASGNLMEAARGNETLQRDVFGNIQDRYSPFLQSERQAIGQLGAEMGLSPGEQYTGYRESPAYMAAQEASRVAEEEAKQNINQAAGNTGTLYSGTRGAALVDRGTRGSYERAGIEQNYYQNYLNTLQSLANPAATRAVSDYETNMAGNIGSTNVNAAGAGVNAAATGAQLGLGSMRTGYEGADLMQYLNPGTAGAGFALNGVDLGTAGTPYRLGAQDYRIQGAGGAGSAILSNMPTGQAGSQYRLAGVEAQNAALSDLIQGGANIYSSYLQYGQRQPAATSSGGTYNLGIYG